MATKGTSRHASSNKVIKYITDRVSTAQDCWAPKVSYYRSKLEFVDKCPASEKKCILYIFISLLSSGSTQKKCTTVSYSIIVYRTTGYQHSQSDCPTSVTQPAATAVTESSAEQQRAAAVTQQWQSDRPQLCWQARPSHTLTQEVT